MAGVAGGLGRHFGVDPLIFRIGFVLLTVFGGSGLLLYALGWLAIPEEGASRSAAETLYRRGTVAPVVGIALLVLAGILLLHDGYHSGFGGPFLAVAFIILGVALWWRRPTAGPIPGDDWFYDESEPAPAEAIGAPLAPPPSPPPPPRPPVPPPPPRSHVPRPRSMLGRGTLALVLVLGGVLGLLDAAGAGDLLRSGVFFSLALMIVGGALILGAWQGRARGLIVLGLVLTVLLGLRSAVDVRFEGGFGDRTFRPRTIAQLQDEYELFAGELLLDLSDLDFPARTTTEVDVSVSFGTLRVVLPPDARAVVDADIDMGGEMRLLGQRNEGWDVEDRQVVSGAEGNGTVRLDLRVGAGEIEVDRAAA